jgi:hypothetical protein
VIQKIIFMIFGVYWGLIQKLTWYVEHLVVVTWRSTCTKSVSKLKKNPNEVRKSRNLSGRRVITWTSCVQELRRFRVSWDVGCLEPRHLHVYYRIDHMWRCLGFRHPTSQLARNLLNCCTQPLHVITWLHDKFRGFRTSFGFYVI